MNKLGFAAVFFVFKAMLAFAEEIVFVQIFFNFMSYDMLNKF